jgi:predicted transcriptional regulator of viral defense system
MPIKCCHGCIAPERYPGCHDHCPKYLAEKEKHDAEKAEEYLKRKTISNLIQQRGIAVHKAHKRRKEK